jgi:hypothetical protein
MYPFSMGLGGKSNEGATSVGVVQCPFLLAEHSMTGSEQVVGKK